MSRVPWRMCAVGSVDETEQHDQRTIEPYQVSELYQAVIARRDAESRLARAVQTARGSGASLASSGSIVGTSRQAVKDRYFPSQVAPGAKSARTGRKRAKIG